MTSCQEGHDGTNQSIIWPIGPTTFNPQNQGKSSVIVVEMWDISLVIVHRNPLQICVGHGSVKTNNDPNKDPVACADRR